VESTCAPLKSEDCKDVLADPSDLSDNNTVYLGAVLPMEGPDESTGKPMRNSIELARRDFSGQGGLAPVRVGMAKRPLVVVVCSDNDDAARATTHLTDVVRVPAIIGAAFSGVTLALANEVTIPKGVLLISPSATSTYITDLQDSGLVWRTSPPDTLQAVAVAGTVAAVEPQVRSTAGLMAADKIKLAIAHRGDGYGVALADALFTLLEFNGLSPAEQEAFFLRTNYGDPDDPANTNPEMLYNQSVQKVLDMTPHVIILIGTSESVTHLYENIESGWSPGTTKPFYVVTDGGQLPELLALVDDEKRTRILGTVPGTVSSLYGLFKSQYHSVFADGTSAQVFGSAGAGDLPVTGLGLVAGLKRLVQPASVAIDVGGSGINAAHEKLLTTTENVDFNGASGPLDFDVATGEAPSDIQVWCISKVATSGDTTFANTGFYYDAIDEQMKGAIACP
jgi:branched-chain amino acid transport system substrate-binding protein